MKYTVMLGVDRFTFDDGSTAISFAELAMTHFTPTEYTKGLKPLIAIEEEGEDDECEAK